MKKQSYDVLDIPVKVPMPVDSGELNSIANVVVDGNLVDIACDLAIKHAWWHGLRNDLGAMLADRITELKATVDGKTFEPNSETEVVKKADGTEVPRKKVIEPDGAYVKRALASNVVTKDQLAAWLQEAADSEEYAIAQYFRPGQRESKGPKVPALIRKKVEKWFAEGKQEAAAKKLGKLLKRNVEPTVEDLQSAYKDVLATFDPTA